MIRTILIGAVISIMSNSVFAADIIGKLYPSESSIINPTTTPYQVGSTEVPYLDSDVISTKGSQKAVLLLNSSDMKVTLAHDTVASVSMADNMQVFVQEGAVGIELPAGVVVDINSPSHNTQVSSETAAIAIVVYDDDELSVVARKGNLTVRNDGSFRTLTSGNALTFADQLAPKVVNVQTFSPKKRKKNRLIWWLLGGAAGAWALYEILDDDDDDAPSTPGPVASPSS